MHGRAWQYFSADDRVWRQSRKSSEICGLYVSFALCLFLHVDIQYGALITKAFNCTTSESGPKSQTEFQFVILWNKHNESVLLYGQGWVLYWGVYQLGKLPSPPAFIIWHCLCETAWVVADDSWHAGYGVYPGCTSVPSLVLKKKKKKWPCFWHKEATQLGWFALSRVGNYRVCWWFAFYWNSCCVRAVEDKLQPASQNEPAKEPQIIFLTTGEYVKRYVHKKNLTSLLVNDWAEPFYPFHQISKRLTLNDIFDVFLIF